VQISQNKLPRFVSPHRADHVPEIALLLRLPVLHLPEVVLLLGKPVCMLPSWMAAAKPSSWGGWQCADEGVAVSAGQSGL